MNASTLLRALALALAVALVSCSKPLADKDALFGVIHEHVHAFEKKDVETVMSTIHPGSPAFADTRTAVEFVFKNLDLKYELSDLKLVSITPEEVKISFVQKTTKTGGTGEFKDNIQEGIHTLRPDNGTWKIYKTLVLKLTDLQGKPLFLPDAAPMPPIEPAGQVPPAATAPAAPVAPAPPSPTTAPAP
ncbi:MAG: hypothetical protein K8R23_16780 [Chthoniobacter sp.]|nr:hypothetical protein [Chthoniobacter sp.]